MAAPRGSVAAVASPPAAAIALTDLAGLVGLSATQFSLHFRETTGQTPYQFVLDLRLDRARELLVAGRHTPIEVAALTALPINHT